MRQSVPPGIVEPQQPTKRSHLTTRWLFFVVCGCCVDDLTNGKAELNKQKAENAKNAKPKFLGLF